MMQWIQANKIIAILALGVIAGAIYLTTRLGLGTNPPASSAGNPTGTAAANTSNLLVDPLNQQLGGVQMQLQNLAAQVQETSAHPQAWNTRLTSPALGYPPQDAMQLPGQH